MENEFENKNVVIDNDNMADAISIALNAARICYSMSLSLDDLTKEYQNKAKELTGLVRRSAFLTTRAASEARAIYGAENYGEDWPNNDNKIYGYRIALDELRKTANEIKRGGYDEI